MIPCGSKIFDEIALSHTVKEFLGKKSKIQNGRHFWGGENFLKVPKSTLLRNLGVENLDEITLSRTVSEINTFLFFQR